MRISQQRSRPHIQPRLGSSDTQPSPCSAYSNTSCATTFSRFGDAPSYGRLFNLGQQKCSGRFFLSHFHIVIASASDWISGNTPSQCRSSGNYHETTESICSDFLRRAFLSSSSSGGGGAGIPPNPNRITNFRCNLWPINRTKFPESDSRRAATCCARRLSLPSNGRPRFKCAARQATELDSPESARSSDSGRESESATPSGKDRARQADSASS